MPINFPKTPSTDETYTFNSITWQWDGAKWVKSAATETGNVEGNTGEVAYYYEKGSNIQGATGFIYDALTHGISAFGNATVSGIILKGTTANNFITFADGSTQGTRHDVQFLLDGSPLDPTDPIHRNLNLVPSAGEIDITSLNNPLDGDAARYLFTIGSNIPKLDEPNTFNPIEGFYNITPYTWGASKYAGGSALQAVLAQSEHATATYMGVTSDSINFKVVGADILDMDTDIHAFVGISADMGATFAGPVNIVSEGDVALNLIADTDNSGENDNPIISMGQDGGEGKFELGVVGNPGQIFTNSTANAAFLNTGTSYNDLQFATNDALRMSIHSTSGDIHILNGVSADMGVTFANDIITYGGLTADGNIHAIGITCDVLRVDGDITSTSGNIIVPDDGFIGNGSGDDRIIFDSTGNDIHLATNTVLVNGAIRHNGDTDTQIMFETDSITLTAGGTNFQTINSGITPGTNFGDTEVTRIKLKDYSETALATSSKSASFNVNFSSGNVQSFTFADDLTVSFTNFPDSGTAGTVTLIITNGGANTTTWNSAVYWPGNNAPALTSSGVDIVSFMTIDAGTKIYGFVGGINFENS